jgi:hypothetical protein
MLRAGLATLIVASLAHAGGRECSLAGEGDVDLCEKIYWRSRLAALAVPQYVVSTDGRTFHHGISWTVAVDVPKDEWSDYFAIGSGLKLPQGFPFQMGAAASFVWLPDYLIEGRLVIRARIISLVWPNSPALSFFHVTAGVGGAMGTDGPTPRIELRLRVGHIAWGGLALVLGFHPNVAKNHYTGDLSAGLEAPWVWWW